MGNLLSYLIPSILVGWLGIVFYVIKKEISFPTTYFSQRTQRYLNRRVIHVKN